MPPVLLQHLAERPSPDGRQFFLRRPSAHPNRAGEPIVLEASVAFTRGGVGLGDAILPTCVTLSVMPLVQRAAGLCMVVDAEHRGATAVVCAVTRRNDAQTRRIAAAVEAALLEVLALWDTDRAAAKRRLLAVADGARAHA